MDRCPLALPLPPGGGAPRPLAQPRCWWGRRLACPPPALATAAAQALMGVLAAALVPAGPSALAQATSGVEATIPDVGPAPAAQASRDRLAGWLKAMDLQPVPVGERTLWVQRNAGQYVMACAHDAGDGFLWVYVPSLARLPEDAKARAALLEWLLRQNGQRFVGSFSVKPDGSIYYEWAGPVPAAGEEQLLRTVWQLLDGEAAGMQSQIAAVVAEAQLGEAATP